MESFHKILQGKIDAYVHSIYKVTKGFPKEEIYGTVSQLRRAALSVALNYVEGFARGSQSRVNRNFIEIAYGSLKESQYLLSFSNEEKFLKADDFEAINVLGNDIGKMLWGILRNLRAIGRKDTI